MIEVDQINYTYGTHKVLDQISFEMNAGQCIAILGNNGAGKSTLLKCISSIYPVKGAAVYISGENIFELKKKELAQNVAYVEQRNSGAQMTVYDAVLLGRKPYMKWDDQESDHVIVESIIQQMGLKELSLRYLDQLSGGELQKVMLARALAQQPKLLLLDEPTSNLDPKNQYEVMSRVKKIAREQKITVVIVIHDLNLALRYCDQFLFLKDRQIYHYGTLEDITPACIQDVYQLSVAIETIHGVPVIIPLPNQGCN